MKTTLDLPDELIREAKLRAVLQGRTFHESARKALQEATASHPAVFCRATQQSFLRLASTPTLFKAME